MKFIKQTIRGCGTLPHFGSHPGTGWLILFIALGALAGRNGGIYGILGGAGIMALGMGPLYLYGAYSRAVESDEIVKREKSEWTANK